MSPSFIIKKDWPRYTENQMDQKIMEMSVRLVELIFLYCPDCGTEILEEMVTCQRCGSTIDGRIL